MVLICEARFGTCDYEPNNISRLLPFTKETFELLKQRFGLPEKFLGSMASRASASFKHIYEREIFEGDFESHTCKSYVGHDAEDIAENWKVLCSKWAFLDPHTTT